MKKEPAENSSLLSANNPNQEEFKMVGPAPVSNSIIKAAKDSIRKLPMFETYQEDTGEYDFEWPNKATLKQITSIKQLQLKEIRYQQDAIGIITAIKMIAHDSSSPFFSA